MELLINILFIFSVVTLILSVSYFYTAAKEVRKGFKKDNKKIKSEDEKAYLTLIIFFVTLTISFVLSIIFY